jgi:magnesium chelatase family protein
VTAIHSVAGLLSSGHPLVARPPLRAPHHTATRAAILGACGQGITRPGDAALAHRGVLFLANAPEFAADVLAALRQPLQAGEIVISRGDSIVRLPARFTLIAGVAPCPCGGRPGCACTLLQARRYRARLAGHLGSWISLWLQVTPSSLADEGGQDNTEDSDALSVARIAAARDRARRRLRDTPWQLNADIPGAELRRAYQADAEALAPLRRAVDLGEISQRAMDQVLRVAWTLADLAGRGRPGAQDCGQALALQLGVAR